jgi:hypothetical protein
MELLVVAKACFALSALFGAVLVYVVFHEPVDSPGARRNGRHDQRSRGRPTLWRLPQRAKTGRSNAVATARSNSDAQ